MNDEQKIDEILERLDMDFHKYHDGSWDFNGLKPSDKARQALLALVSERDGDLIDERDRLERNLESLSDAVGAYFHKDLGEHSSANDPWYNAFELLRDNTEKAAIQPGEKKV